MVRLNRRIAILLAAALLAPAAPVRAELETACTALDICYCINSDYLGAINANVARVRRLLALRKAEGKAIGYLSVPLSPAGGGSYQINLEAAQYIASEVERRFGASSTLILNPGAEGSDAMNGAGGADYMYMWSQILEGPSGRGDDFDFFYFAGPTDFANYFLRSAEAGETSRRPDPGEVDDYLGKLNDFFDRRVERDPEFKQAVERGLLSRQGFRRYYGLRASVAFSYGSHDEWNIARLINQRRRGATEYGMANQLAILFDGRSADPGAYESAAAWGDAGRCVK
jgi:hypothetical protein